jgi:hypothetical protein
MSTADKQSMLVRWHGTSALEASQATDQGMLNLFKDGHEKEWEGCNQKNDEGFRTVFLH